jgi:hypothetical protein
MIVVLVYPRLQEACGYRKKNPGDQEEGGSLKKLQDDVVVPQLVAELLLILVCDGASLLGFRHHQID